METCVVWSQHPRNHHNHHHGRSERSGFSSAGSSGLYFSPPPPSRAFRGINCRSALQSGAGILPPPLSAFPPSSSSSRPSSASSSPRSRTTTDPPSPRRQQQPPSRRSSPIPIATKRTTSLPSQSTLAGAGGAYLLPEDGNSSSSGSSPPTELWAGPAYSNSPPPSSLPIPKFSLRGKRSASLDLPHQREREELRPLPMSAPASPSRESSTGSPPASRLFSDAFASATSDLCRMLNLNLDEE